MFEDLYALLCNLLDTASQSSSKTESDNETGVSKIGTDEEVCAAALLALTDLLCHCEERWSTSSSVFKRSLSVITGFFLSL